MQNGHDRYKSYMEIKYCTDNSAMIDQTHNNMIVFNYAGIYGLTAKEILVIYDVLGARICNTTQRSIRFIDVYII